MRIAVAILASLALTVQAASMTGDSTSIITAAALHQHLAQLAPQAQSSGSSGATLAKFGNLELKLSVRTSSGGAEIHAHFDDLMIVQQGSATLITGGTVIAAKTGSDGETHGSGIERGTRRELHEGDVVIVPAGTPHQLLVPQGTLYSAMVAKIKEP